MSDILVIGQILSVMVLIGMEAMLWWQVRKLNKNFVQLWGRVDLMFKQLDPLIKALNKATPFLEVVNGVIGWIKDLKKKK